MAWRCIWRASEFLVAFIGGNELAGSELKQQKAKRRTGTHVFEVVEQIMSMRCQVRVQGTIDEPKGRPRGRSKPAKEQRDAVVPRATCSSAAKKRSNEQEHASKESDSK